MATGFLGGGNDFLVCCIRLAETNVVAYRVLEQIDILEHHRDVAYQTFGGYFVHRYIAKEDASLLRVVKTGAKFHHRAFPASRRANKSCQGVLGKRDGYVVQHFLVLISKRYVLKPDVACRWGLPVTFHFRLVH